MIKFFRGTKTFYRTLKYHLKGFYVILDDYIFKRYQEHDEFIIYCGYINHIFEANQFKPEVWFQRSFLN